MNPAALVHLQPEMLAKYAHAALPVTPCAAPQERKWAGVAFVALLMLAPLVIALIA
jgi:hypothetical protein